MMKKRPQRSCSSTYRTSQVLNLSTSSESETENVNEECEAVPESGVLENGSLSNVAFKLTPARFNFTKSPHISSEIIHPISLDTSTRDWDASQMYYYAGEILNESVNSYRRSIQRT